jgi:hypothetical protein
MSKRLVQAIENYETMLRLQSAGRLSEHEIQQRVIRYRSAAAEEWAVLASVRPILCNHGIPTLQFAMYHAFSRQLGKLRRQDRTPARMQEELPPILMKWTLRGLDEATLVEIAATVFSLQLPAAAGKSCDLTQLG